jgi:hypothetical protein
MQATSPQLKVGYWLARCPDNRPAQCRSAPGIFTMYSRGLSSPPRLQNHAGKSVQQVNEGSPAKWRLASN